MAVRRIGAGIIAIAIAALWWQFATPAAEGIFGLYSRSRFLALSAASFLLIWAIYFLLSRQTFSAKLVNFSITAATLAIIIGLLELPSLLGLVDYSQVISPPASYLMTTMKPWDNPANLLDRDLMHIHRPGERIVGQAKGDLVDWLGIKTERRYLIDVQFDRNGFRNDHNIDKAEVAILGDSFVEGILVSQSDLVSSRLKNELGVEVANLGQSGYGPQQELEVLRRFALGLKPKAVIWFFFEGNDLLDVPRYERFRRDYDRIKSDRESFSKRSFVKNTLITLEGLTAKPKTGAKAISRSGTFTSSSNKRNETLYFAYLPAALSDDDLESLEKAQQSFLQAQKLAKENNTNLLVVYVPTKLRVYSDYCTFPTGGLGNTEQNDLPLRMDSWCKQNGLPFLDLTPALKERAANGELVYFSDDGHWNANGHLVAAQAISQYFVSRGWFEQKKT